MKIIVCIKQVVAIDLNLDMISDKGIDPDDIIYTVNPYDLVAVEEAVRIKEKIKNSEVILISLGPFRTKEALKKCLAMGADEAYHLWDRIFDQSDPWATSIILSKLIKSLDYDLILCGKKSIDQNNGQTGTFIAELLGLPHIYGVTKLEIEESGVSARVHRAREGGDREIVSCPLPAVLSVDVELNQPRYPSLPACLSALRKEIKTLDAKALGVTRRQVGKSSSISNIVTFSLSKPRVKTIYKIDSNLSAEERLKLVMSGGIKSKNEKIILKGEPIAIAREVVRILSEQEII